MTKLEVCAMAIFEGDLDLDSIMARLREHGAFPESSGEIERLVAWCIEEAEQNERVAKVEWADAAESAAIECEEDAARGMGPGRARR